MRCSVSVVHTTSGSRVGIQALDVGTKIGYSYAGGTFHMHQRQTTSGNQSLNGSEGNTELLGGFALG